MHRAIDARDVAGSERVFLLAHQILTDAEARELRYKRERNFEPQYASWKIAICVQRLQAKWLVETKDKKLRYLLRQGKVKYGAPTGLIMLDAPGRPPQIGIDRRKSQQLRALGRLSEEQFQAVLADETMPSLARIIKLYATPKCGSRRVRGPMELHPITGDYDDLTGHELTALRESLRAHGLVVPVVVWRNEIVDGRHRAKLCQELGIELRTNDISKQCSTEAEMIARVRALNEHRRANTKPLTAAEKRARTEAALKTDSERSDHAITEEVGVSQPTVSDRRKKLQDGG